MSVAEQQSFIDVPTNTTVVQGQTVVLPCSVASRKGDVQWTKDGFALGQLRFILRFPGRDGTHRDILQVRDYNNNVRVRTL